MLRTCVILVASLLGLGPRVFHCQETIIADRPGIGSSSFVLGGGTLQLDGGGEFAHSDADQYNLGQLLVRFGLPWFELGAQFNSFVIKRSAEDDGEGFQDLGLRIKGRLWSPETVVAMVSLTGTLNIPTGSTFLTGDEVIPTITLLGDYKISIAGRYRATSRILSGPVP